jgi:hypothetical protein
MEMNEGFLDRGVRIALGLALVAFPLGVYGLDHAYQWGWIGVLPMLSGMMGICPAYALMGIKTTAA